MNDSANSRLAADLDGSFEEFVRDHQDRLFSLALRYTGSPHDAEELTQDAFVRAYRALSGYDAQRIQDLNVRGWLTTIVLNLCRNHRSRPMPPVVALDPIVEFAGRTADSPEATIERREAAQRWADLVAGLPPRYRAAVLLRHLDGWSYPEMAAQLGRPEGTVKAQVHRGIELLRAAFQAAERADAEAPSAAGRRSGESNRSDRLADAAARSGVRGSPTPASNPSAPISHQSTADQPPGFAGLRPARETLS